MNQMMTETGARLYSWDQLPEDFPREGISRRRVIGQQMMISQVHLRKGAFVPSHAHANEQLVCLMSGRLKFEIGAESDSNRHTMIVSAGQVLHLPANVPHSALAMEDTDVLDLFSPPSETTGVDRPH